MTDLKLPVAVLTTDGDALRVVEVDEVDGVLMVRGSAEVVDLVSVVTVIGLDAMAS